MNDKSSVKTTVTIQSHLEMVGFIKANGTSCRFVSMLSQTPVVKIKAGNPFHKVSKGKVVGDCKLFKVSRKMGLINADYNTSVRNRIAEKLGVSVKDVEYENGEVWYEHVKTADAKNLPLVQHKTKNDGKYYLQYYPHKSTNCYVDENGTVIPDEQVTPWLYAETKREEFKPCVIAVAVENVKELRASGIIMQAEDVEVAEEALASAQ